MNNDSIVTTNHLTKNFELGHERINILDNVSLQIKANEFVILMGPSGSGKTTFLNLLSGVDRQFSGEIYLSKTNIAKLNARQISLMRSSKIGMVFQDYRLLPQLTTEENVETPLYLQKFTSKERKIKVQKSLELVGLSKRLHHKPQQLSGGERQRVAIARALVTGADLLLCDEPTGNLNSDFSKMIFDLLKSLCHEHGKSIIMTTHDPLAEPYADRVITFDNSQLLDKHLNNGYAEQHPIEKVV